MPTSFLEDAGIDRYNRRFKRIAANDGSAYRPCTGVDLHRILAFRYPATVLNDNTVRLGGLIFDIPPGPAAAPTHKPLSRSDSTSTAPGLSTTRPRHRHGPASSLAEPLRYRNHHSKRPRSLPIRSYSSTYRTRTAMGHFRSAVKGHIASA